MADSVPMGLLTNYFIADSDVAAAAWGGIEELGLDAGSERPAGFLHDLAGLARRAGEQGCQVYCRLSL